MIGRLTIVAALGLLCLQVPPRPAVLRAYYDRGALLIDSPIELPWDEWVPAKFQSDALRRDHDRRRDYFLQAEQSEIKLFEESYQRPLPADLAGMHFYLVDSAGVRRVRPTGLEGVVRIGWSGSDTAFAVTTYGFLRLADSTIRRGGLVIVADRPIDLTTSASDFAPRQLLEPNAPGIGTPFQELIHQFRIRGPGGLDWVWVQWRPDTANVEAGCQLRVAIFRIGTPPVEIGGLDTECDI